MIYTKNNDIKHSLPNLINKHKLSTVNKNIIKYFACLIRIENKCKATVVCIC